MAPRSAAASLKRWHVLGLLGLTYAPLLSSLVGVVCRLARAVTIFALCCAIGVQWLALQSIAWAAMIVDYSKRGSLCEAIAQTFDGAHPCSLCHIINNGKTADKKSDVQVPTPKIDIICTKRVITLLQSFVVFHYATSNSSVSKVAQSPPVPPPRNFFEA